MDDEERVRSTEVSLIHTRSDHVVLRRDTAAADAMIGHASHPRLHPFDIAYDESRPHVIRVKLWVVSQFESCPKG